MQFLATFFPFFVPSTRLEYLETYPFFPSIALHYFYLSSALSRIRIRALNRLINILSPLYRYVFDSIGKKKIVSGRRKIHVVTSVCVSQHAYETTAIFHINGVEKPACYFAF